MAGVQGRVLYITFTINIVYFGRVGGSLLLQQIRIIYKVGSLLVYVCVCGTSLSHFIYSINKKKKLKIQNTKNIKNKAKSY